MTEAPRTLVVTDNRIELQQCTLYRSHWCAVIEQHHIAPKSWWLSAGLPVDTPLVAICPTCHLDTHGSLDGLIAGRDVTAIPPRCVALARQALAIAAAHGLTPAPTL